MSLDFQRSYTERELASFDRLHEAEDAFRAVASELCREFPDEGARLIVNLEREVLDAHGFCVSDCLGDVEAYNDIVAASTCASVDIYRDKLEDCRKVEQWRQGRCGGDA